MNSLATTPTRRNPALSPLSAALFAALPVFAVLVSVPANIYLGNQPYFNFQYAIPLHLGLVHVAFTFILYLIFRFKPSLGEAASPWLGAVGLFLIVRSLLAGSPVGELLDGRIGEVEATWQAASIDLAVLAGVALLMRALPVEVFVHTGAQFAVITALAVPAVVALESWRQPDSTSRWTSIERPAPARAAASPNVYHIVFDGFDGSLAPLLIRRLRLEADLAGFVSYERAYANYTSTRLSFPSFMTGRAFDSTITDEKGMRIGQQEGLIRTLGELGYTATQYNAYFVNNHQLTHVRRSTAQIEARTYGNLRPLVQLLDLSILTLLPTGLKSLGVHQGRGLISHWLWSAQPSIADWSRNPPLLSLQLFDQMIQEEASRPATGQYVLGHFLLPHAPHTLSAKCVFEPTRNDSRKTLVDQAACSVQKLVEFTRRLRELGRYESALILVHADHGILHRDRPALLAKYPGRGSEPFEIARHPVQLLDIAPTIHAVLGLPGSGLQGAPLWDSSKDARDEIKVWVAKPTN